MTEPSTRFIGKDTAVGNDEKHPINWRENYIRTKLYAHQNFNGDQSAYDALVVSLLSPPLNKTRVEN
jgi:hypothetical protein